MIIKLRKLECENKKLKLKIKIKADDPIFKKENPEEVISIRKKNYARLLDDFGGCLMPHDKKSSFYFATTLTINANDVISIAAQSINLNGATIVDAIGGGNAVRTISADVGSAAGTITVGS